MTITSLREREVDDHPRPASTYARLAAAFDVHHKDPRGLEYLTGNQVIGRLNDVLGPSGWSFSVREHGYDAESDEVWVLGRLTARIVDDLLEREQFGSQKHNRRKAAQGQLGAILDYGFDLKGAATDALKKCATLIGVGLYLSEKEGGIPQGDDQGARPVAPVRAPAPQSERHLCVECMQPIIAQDGKPINANQASVIRDRFGALVCREHRGVKA